MALRIALVATPLGGPSAQVHPLGCMAIGSFVLEELGPQVVDCKVFNFIRDPARALREVVCFKPDIIGFPVYSGHVDEVTALARQVRQHLPRATLVAGGPHVTLTWFDFIARWGDLFHYAVNGDGELPVLAIAQARLSGDWAACHALPGIGRKTKLGVAQQGAALSLPADRWINPFLCEVATDSDTLYFSDRMDRKHRRAVALVSSRSCPLKCSFCAIIAMPGKWRAAPVATLLDWLQLEWARQPFEHVYFMDANFFVSPKRVREVAEQLRQRFGDVTWSTSSTVGYFLKMEDDIPWLVAHGLRAIELGLEAGSAEQLAFLNKQATAEQNLRSVELIQRNRLVLGLDFIMFYPDQSLSGLRENLDFLHQASLLDEDYSDHFYTALVLYPGTPLRTFYEKRLGAPFPPDELPDIRDMFIDPVVKEVYRLFVLDYGERHRTRIEAVVKAWRTEATRCQAARPRRAQQLRFGSIRLHHLPYRLLHTLAGLPLATLQALASVDELWPWLAALDTETDGAGFNPWPPAASRQLPPALPATPPRQRLAATA